MATFLEQPIWSGPAKTPDGLIKPIDGAPPPTGLIGTTSTAPVAPTQPAPGSASYNPTPVAAPTPWTVDSKQTVAGQVKDVIDENGPLQQQAATRADQQMNRRGLINSSIAVGAGQAAVMDAALPIASADSATYGKAAGYSVDQINQNNVQNAQLTNSASQFNAGAANTRSNIELDNANRVQLQAITNQNQNLIQTNNQAASLMQQATAVVGNIMMNDKMDSAAKTESARQVYANLKVQMSILGKTSGLDLSSLLIDNPYDAGGSRVPGNIPPPPPEGPHGSVFMDSVNRFQSSFDPVGKQLTSDVRKILGF